MTMSDGEALVRAWVAGTAGIIAIAGARIYSDTALPAEYRPSDGPAVLFSTRGGPPDYTAKVLKPSMQFRCYGLTAVLARQLDRALFEALNDQRSGIIKWAHCDVLGQLLTEPTTGWPFVLSFYSFMIGN